MRAEVAVLSRPTIIIRGVNSLFYNFRFHMMEKQEQGVFIKVSDDAIVDLSGVKLKDGGCTSTSLTCGDWLPLKSYPLFISMGTRALITMQGCVIQPEYGHGVQAASGHFYDNIVYKPSTGFRFFAQQQKNGPRPQTMTSGVKNAAKHDEPSATVGDSPLVARYNAVFSVREKGSLGYAEWDSFYVLRGSPYFDGNAGAGSTTIGYQFATWDNGADRFYNNSGHAIGQVGASFLGGVITPVTDLTLWMVEIAVWGYAKTDTPVFGPGLRLADFKKGFVWGFIGADSEEHTVRMQTLSIVDSLMVGRAKSNTYCSAGVGVGIMLAIAGTKGFSISPETCGPLGGHWTRGIYGPESPLGQPRPSPPRRVCGA